MNTVRSAVDYGNELKTIEKRSDTIPHRVNLK